MSSSCCTGPFRRAMRYADAEDHGDEAERQPLVHLEVDHPDRVQVLDEQLEADPGDDDERGIDERRILTHDRQQLADHQPHGDDAEEAADQDHPRLARHRHGDQDGIDRERDVDELDLHHGSPQRRQPHPGLCGLRLAALVSAAAREEVVVGEVHEIEPAQQLDPADLDQVRRQKRRHDAERERPDQPIFECLFLIGASQAQDHHRQHQGVVGAQQSFEDDEETNGDEIFGLKNHSADIQP